MYRNPQLRITWNEDAVNGSVVVNECSVYAYVDDQPAGGGARAFLRAQEVKSEAMGTSGHLYADLPVDLPIRGLLIRAQSDDHDVTTLLSKIKISLDNDAKVPLDIEAAQYLDMIKGQYGRISQKLTLDDAVTENTFWADLAEDQAISIEYDQVAFVTTQTTFGEAVFTGQKVVIAASVDIKKLTAQLSGHLPGSCFPIWFGDKMNPEQFLITRGLSAAKLDITTSSDADSGDTLTTVVQQVKTY
jgi:hypothetical protein